MVRPTEKDVLEFYRNRVPGFPKEEVTLDSRLGEDLLLDSLDLFEQGYDIEQEYGIDIPDEQIQKFRTVGDIVRYVLEQTQQ